MPKRSTKSDDPIISAKRILDQVIAKHDPDSMSKATSLKRKQATKTTQKRRK